MISSELIEEAHLLILFLSSYKSWRHASSGGNKGSEWVNDGSATSIYIPAVSAIEDIHDNRDTSTTLVVMNLQEQRWLAAAAADSSFLTCTIYELLRPPQHVTVNGHSI